MHDHHLYLKTLSEFTRTLLTPYDADAMLIELTGRVTEVLALAGCGVTLARDGQLDAGTARGGAVEELERAQEEAQDGPCITAFRTGRIVAVPHLPDRAGDWPEYCRVAQRVGICSVVSIPMGMGDLRIGALNLYVRESREWPRDDIEAAAVMADIATAYLLNASYHSKQVELNEQLQHALDSRLVIEQAKGMLAARHDISPDRAYELLRRHARERGAAVRTAAEAVVTLGLEI